MEEAGELLGGVVEEMTVAEELYRIGIPEAECESLAKKLIDAAVASGYPSALENILYSVRFLVHKQKPPITAQHDLRALGFNSKS